MAKTAGVARHAEERLRTFLFCYPTHRRVMASFASLGDVLSLSQEQDGFAGPRD